MWWVVGGCREQTPRTVGVAPIGTRIRLPSRPGHSARTGVPSAAYTGTSPLAGLRSLLRSDGGNRPPFVQLACRRPWSVVYEPSAAAWPLSRHCSAGAAGRHDTSQIAVHWFALLTVFRHADRGAASQGSSQRMEALGTESCPSSSPLPTKKSNFVQSMMLCRANACLCRMVVSGCA